MHDFKANPELRDSEMDLYFQSPHKQIFADFHAKCVKVHDGDTITVRVDWRDFDFPIRFARIDTKELSEGGSNAADYTRERLEGKNIEVLINPDNRVGKYGRLIGDIIVGGINLNDELMRVGLATPFAQRGEGQLPNLNKELRIEKWF